MKVPLSPPDKHHLLTVLRLVPPAEIIVVDRVTGGRFAGVLATPGGKDNECFVAIIRQLDTPANTCLVAPIGALLVAHCKNKVTEFLIEKAAELGCPEVIVWRGDRSIPVLTDDRAIAAKLDRWQSIAEGAAKQSLQSTVTVVRYASSLDKAVEGVAGLFSVVCSLGEIARPVCELPDAYTQQVPEQAALYVGPEGDFSPREESLLKTIPDVFHLSLGDARLRVDTAVLYALSIVSTVLKNAKKAT